MQRHVLGIVRKNLVRAVYKELGTGLGGLAHRPGDPQQLGVAALPLNIYRKGYICLHPDIGFP